MSIMPEPFPNYEANDHISDSNSSLKSGMSHKKKTLKLLSQKLKAEQIQSQQKMSPLQKIVENIMFQIFITLLTICSLFMEDFRIIFVEKSSDTIIDALNISFIVIFMVEILMSLSIPGYAWSFFFFLDVLSTLSIMLDISLLTNLLYSNNGGSTEQLNLIIRNSKASRAAARTVRVMKIFRLARIVKLYKSALKTKQLNNKKKEQMQKKQLIAMKLKKIKEVLREQEGDRQQTFTNIEDQKNHELEQNHSHHHSHNHPNSQGNHNNHNHNKVKFTETQKKIFQNQPCHHHHHHDHEQSEDSIRNKNEQIDQIMEESDPIVLSQESKISKMLSDSTMKKIIIVILFLMFSVPALQITNYREESNAWDFLVSFLAKALESPQIELEKINEAIEKTIEASKQLDTKEELILFRTPFTQLYTFDSGLLNTLRITDIQISQASLDMDQILSHRNLTANDKQFKEITVILSSREFNRLDSWFSIVKILFICFVIIYLLNTFNGIISELITEPIEKMLEEVKNQGKKEGGEANEENSEQGKGKNENNYQTTMVHQAISKISKVISKVFGRSGKQLIYERIFDKGTVFQNYLSESKEHFCILGVCTIENYESIREIIGPQVIHLYNEISQYLHSAVYRYGGNAVANYDNCFLVSFKCPPEFQPAQDQVQNFKPVKQEYLNILADFAMCAMVKTIVKINKQSKFYKYKKDTRILKQLGQVFQVKLTCNLHSGWVNEAFLGSSFKMDMCQYGQPLQQILHLARYTKKCGNNIILTEECYSLLTDGMKKYLRVIQKFQGQNPINYQSLIYRVDLNLQNISPPKTAPLKQLGGVSQISPTSLYLKRQLNFQILRNQQEIAQYKAFTFVTSKKELREVLKNVIGEQFRKKYALAYELIQVQDWFQAREILQQLLSFNKEDPLVLGLLNQIPEPTLMHQQPNIKSRSQQQHNKGQKFLHL